MSQQICALCLKEKTLKESHLIPKFVGTWLKDNGTGYLVCAEDGSKRVQDIVKIKLLCEYCEQKFSKLENHFAKSIFYPFHKDKVREFDYDENLKPFIISMAWRCIQPIKDDFIKENPTLQVNSFIDKAEKEWREFLNGNSNLIDSYETHLLFLDYLQSTENMEVDPKFHWYLLHTTDFTIIYDDTMAYFYVKFPWMIFVISIEPKKLEGWEGTIVNKNGHIAMPQTVKAPGFAEFLQDRAKLALYSSEGPSDEVATKRMLKAIEKDPEKYLTSNIYESWIVERDNVRKKKMENMPVSVIELVEAGILDGKAPPDTKLVNSQAHKLITRRIADRIADLSDMNAQRLHEMIYAVNRMSQILKKNTANTFTSDSLYITYIVSFDTTREVRAENLQKELDKLKVQTQDKIHYAAFSFSPIFDNYQSGFFVPQEYDSKKGHLKL